jgi:hypothetical protein
VSAVQPPEQPADEPAAPAAATPDLDAPDADAPDADAPDLDAALAIPLDGGGRFAGGRSTPPRAAVADDGPHVVEVPERLLLVPLLASTSVEGARCLLVRLVGAEQLSLLPMGRPGVEETLADAVASVLRARLGLRPSAEPRIAERRVPSRLPQPRRGTSGAGWLRAVVVRVEGEPVPGPLVEEVLDLPLDEAARALSTDAERLLLALATG